MSAPTSPRPFAELDVPLARLEADLRKLVVRQRLAQLDELREHLPLADPDRHALDTVADARFDALVCGSKGGAA